LPTENGSIRDRDGGISVMLSSPDGRIFGGKVVGQLIASAPTKVTFIMLLPIFYIVDQSYA
jgi:hypothetical protein